MTAEVDALDGTNIQTWHIASASLRGTSHEKSNQPCQDANYWRETPHGFLVAAVADGAGSAPLSQIGSAIAVKTAVDVVCDGLTILSATEIEQQLNLALREAIASARQAVEAEAISLSVSSRDLATTLIVVVTNALLTAVAQIGDGASLACDVDGNVWGLTVPQNGEYANEVTFLTSPNALEMAQVSVQLRPLINVAILSDGLQMLALNMPEGSPYEPFFKPLFQFINEVEDEPKAIKELVQFLNSSRVRNRADDDLTLMLASNNQVKPRQSPAG